MNTGSNSLLLVLLLLLGTGTSLGTKNCKDHSNCGVVLHIKPPFWFKGDSQNCGHPDYQLTCEHNRTMWHLGSNKFVVEAINYRDLQVHITFPGLLKDNCSSLPNDSIDYRDLMSHFFGYFPKNQFSSIVFLICKSPVKAPYYVDTAPCITTKDLSGSFVYPREEYFHSYAFIGDNQVASHIVDSCIIYKMAFSRYMFVSGSSNISFADIHKKLASGVYFNFPYSGSFLRNPKLFHSYPQIGIGAIVAGIMYRGFLGIIVLIIFLIHKCKRRHLSEYDTIEEFLKGSNNLLPIRYSYKEIKQMTKNFKDKLGKGGYGDVYKGKSRSGHLVAVKMLNEAKSSDQDFINEVSTIGRIYHLNVVGLVGFCVTASKRALVYDYMSNGSLDKFIFSEDQNGISLSWERAHEISVGVARGITYLHQGCHMQILHFDIKPHNILLDDSFVPKVSDFGLAKLCPRQKSAITLTAVKGTLGYMAPELIYRKIGEVSHKADVYSFGQLLLAMVGKRKVSALTDHSSRVYFSSWIYDKVDRGEEQELDLGDITKEEKDIVRKIILVALWCVQWVPTDRPSMKEVLEMLEGDLEGLKLPAKPLYYPVDSPPREFGDSGDSTFPLYESIASEIQQSEYNKISI